jgi:hypothetical protein
MLLALRLRGRSLAIGGMIAVGTLLAFGPPATVQAQTVTTTTQSAAVNPVRLDRKACRAELASVCATRIGSRIKCLVDNQASLSPTCSTAVKATMDARQLAKSACVSDAQKLCGTVRGAARMQCLEGNKTQLSPACLARVEQREIRVAAKQAKASPKQ